MRFILAAALAAPPNSDDEWSSRAAYRAVVEASHRTDDGHLAQLLTFWVLGHELTPERLREADAILSGDDPRQAQVEEFVHQICTSAITWDEFAKRLKKGLIKDLPPTVEPVPQDAIPLADALALLDRMLSESKDRSVQAIAQTFFAFAARPVAASPPLHVENDMCLFQWGRYDSGGVPHFECDFTRQFVLEDADGDYDHMEQLSLTLLFTPDESGLAELGSGELWSGDDLNGWTRQVAEHKVLLVLRTKPPTDKRLNHSEV